MQNQFIGADQIQQEMVITICDFNNLIYGYFSVNNKTKGTTMC